MVKRRPHDLIITDKFENDNNWANITLVIKFPPNNAKPDEIHRFQIQYDNLIKEITKAGENIVLKRKWL